ncbi:hypothetical protein [Cysteiniphilum halobium]|uniref:hypothetical protein n=1 Tax=Cysteiniphilum halobium TaxID=2219059 RepID=UPI003F87E4F4
MEFLKLGIVITGCCLGSIPLIGKAAYKADHVMSMAELTTPNTHIFNNQTVFNTPHQGYSINSVANTQFANDGGMVGCGTSYPLMQAIYKTAGTAKNYAKNYIALNVFSNLMGYNPQAPYWSSSSGEGNVKGYVTFKKGANGYPYRHYYRIIPALYPSYLGLYNNGLNCGRWLEVNTSEQTCNGASGNTVGFASKACQNKPATEYQNQHFYGYVFDSCEDNNGWCRDDTAHIDINSAIIHQNYFLSWHFAKNPYYSDQSVPSSLHDVWLAWYGVATKWWSYLTVANTPNGLGMMQYNIGAIDKPVWVDSHFMGGGNDLYWSSGSSNGQLWKVEPINTLTRAEPSDDPSYEVRFFGTDGYPINGGKRYIFKLKDSMESGEKIGSNYTLFYKGEAGDGSSVVNPPLGNASLTLSFEHLPKELSLSALKPVIISQEGYSYQPVNCSVNSCIFDHIPQGEYRLYAYYAKEDLDKLNTSALAQVTVNQAGLFTDKANLPINAQHWDYTVLYSGEVKLPMTIKSNQQIKTINANLQAWFTPVAGQADISASTQGCFLHTYFDKNQTYTECKIYFTVHSKTGFNTDNIYQAAFNISLPSIVGTTDQAYVLTQQKENAAPIVEVKANEKTTLQQSIEYSTSSLTSRSVMLWLDSNSSPSCINNLKRVDVKIGNDSYYLTAKDLGTPKVVNMTDSLGKELSVSALPELSNKENCIASVGYKSFTVGDDLVEAVKLSKSAGAYVPPSPPTPPKPPKGKSSCQATILKQMFTGGCNVTFNIRNTGKYNIVLPQRIHLLWNYLDQTDKPWTGSVTIDHGNVNWLLPSYITPIASGAIIDGKSQGLGITIHDLESCHQLQQPLITCKIQ